MVLENNAKWAKLVRRLDRRTNASQWGLRTEDTSDEVQTATKLASTFYFNTEALLEIIDVEWVGVTGDEFLQFRRGKHFQPIGSNDGFKAADEGRGLLTNLNAHPEVGHSMDVTDPGLEGWAKREREAVRKDDRKEIIDSKKD